MLTLLIIGKDCEEVVLLEQQEQSQEAPCHAREVCPTRVAVDD